MQSGNSARRSSWTARFSATVCTKPTLPSETRTAGAAAAIPIVSLASLPCATALSMRSAAEQGIDKAPELDELNAAYEERFGFRFVVFVNRRPKSAIVPVLRERLERTREQELTTALDELVSIAEDRWRRS